VKNVAAPGRKKIRNSRPLSECHTSSLPCGSLAARQHLVTFGVTPASARVPVSRTLAVVVVVVDVVTRRKIRSAGRRVYVRLSSHPARRSDHRRCQSFLFSHDQAGHVVHHGRPWTSRTAHLPTTGRRRPRPPQCRSCKVNDRSFLRPSLKAAPVGLVFSLHSTGGAHVLSLL